MCALVLALDLASALNSYQLIPGLVGCGKGLGGSGVTFQSYSLYTGADLQTRTYGSHWRCHHSDLPFVGVLPVSVW